MYHRPREDDHEREEEVLPLSWQRGIFYLSRGLSFGHYMNVKC